MAKIGNILFNRLLGQFLECEDVESTKGAMLIEKISASANDNLDKLLETITQVADPHRAALKSICYESVEGFSEDYFIDVLANENTILRAAASDILSNKNLVDASKLFKRLHEPGASIGEVIAVLEAQNFALKPEDIINHAMKLEPDYGVQLLKLVEGCERAVDLSKLNFHLEKIESPIFKINLLSFLGGVNEPKVPLIVIRFLDDTNKVVVLEALKTLSRMKIDFDASGLLPYTESMTEVELEFVLQIISKQADASLVPHLSAYLNSKSSERNDLFARILVVNADKHNFEKFLKRLMLEDEWTRQQSIACVQKYADDRLSDVAREFLNHQVDFIREAAEALVVKLIGDDDLGKIEEFALSDNWQVRERAIQSLGKSANRGAIPIMQKQLKTYPEDIILILRAVRQLGFGKGLKIAFSGLKHVEANVQRAALETIEAITTEKHATNVRDTILWSLPSLDPTMREFAKMLMAQVTQEFGLPDIQIDESSNVSDAEVNPALFGKTPPPDAAEKLSMLDKFKPGRIWMDRFKIKREIGRGAMGRVLLADDDMVDEVVVLKFMLPELTVDQQSIARFKREVKFSRRVTHRNVIRVHDILLQDKCCAISMEYFGSQGMDNLLGKDKIFETEPGLNILFQIASGMAAAHEEEVIHRDLKPSNVLINRDQHIKVVDFGIASAGAAAESTLTQTGSIIGSPAYLAPERGEGIEADERSDIYSLGVIAYYMFSGRLPYTGKPMEVISKHRKGGAPLVHEINDSASPEVSQLIAHMMAVDPSDRPQSMGEIRDRVQSLLEST